MPKLNLSKLGMASETSPWGPLGAQKFICKSCGKEYKRRFAVKADWCDECLQEKDRLQSEIRGYIDYCKSVFNRECTVEELREYVNHRDKIVDKYKTDTTGSELIQQLMQYAGKTSADISEEDAAKIIVYYSNFEMAEAAGIKAVADLAFPDYDGVIIDANDICGLGCELNKDVKKFGYEYYTIYVFTKDPYIPVFPCIFSGKKGFLEFKSEEGRCRTLELFTDKMNTDIVSVGPVKQVMRELREAHVYDGYSDKLLNKLENDMRYGYSIFSTQSISNFAQLRKFSTPRLIDKLACLENGTTQRILTDRKAGGDWKFWHRIGMEIGYFEE